uniref:Uncharacterized protein n=1 Tax=Arundo donax TaxID=35708 RepID=A0A0A9HA03_ARUDO
MIYTWSYLEIFSYPMALCFSSSSAFPMPVTPI